MLHGGPAVADGVRRTSARPPARRQAGLALTHLCLHGGRPVPREDLADACWPAGPPTSVASSLRRVLSDLRSWLQEAGATASVSSAHGCYVLDLGHDRVDLEVAASAVAAAELLPGPDALQVLREAEVLTREPLVPGLAAPWLDDARVHAQARRWHLLEALAEAERRHGDPDAAVAAAEEVLRGDPLREPAHRLLIAAHHRAGRTASALQAYEQCRAVLLDQVGVTPSPETVLLHRQVLGAEGLAVLPTTGPALGEVRSRLARIEHEERIVALETRLGDLDLHGSGDVARRLDLLVELGRARWSSRRSASQVLDVALSVAHVALVEGSRHHLAEAAALLAVNTGVGRADAEILDLCARALRTFPDDDVVRARVLTLRAELASGDEAVQHGRAAVAAARRAGHPGVLLDALLGLDRSTAWRPADAERLDRGRECAELAGQVLRWRLRPSYEPHTRAQLGDVGWLRHEAARLATLAGSSGQWEPAFYARAYRATSALLSGDVQGAASLAEELLADTRDDVNAINAASGLQLALLREAGGVDELLPVVAAVAAANPGLTAFGAAHALGCAVAHRHDLARPLLERLLAAGLADVDRDLVWLLALGSLAEACALVALEAPEPDQDAAWADLLLPLLEPYAGQLCAGAHGVVVLDSVNTLRGMLLVTRGRGADAEEALRSARRAAQQQGTPLLAARADAWLGVVPHLDPDEREALQREAAAVAAVAGRAGLQEMVGRLHGARAVPGLLP